jgi:hypothetical protein
MAKCQRRAPLPEGNIRSEEAHSGDSGGATTTPLSGAGLGPRVRGRGRRALVLGSEPYIYNIEGGECA